MPASLSKGDESPLKKDTGIFLYAPLRKAKSLVSTQRDSKKAAGKCCTNDKNKETWWKFTFRCLCGLCMSL